MPGKPRPEATEGAFGRLETDAPRYRPLDTVTVSVLGREQGDDSCTVRACTPQQHCYLETQVDLRENAGSLTFQAPGPLGTHYLYLIFDGEERHSRYLNFRVEATTSVDCGDAQIDGLVPFTRDMMRLGRRDYRGKNGRMVGYMSADTVHFDGIWLRDWIYGLPGYRHWELEMQCGLDRFIEAQNPEGMVPDGIERDGRTWRVGLESDVEYIFVLGIWQTWQATGDDAWMADNLPALERALEYVQSDPRHWDPQHRLIKRQHSCDTWDFDIDGASDRGEGRHVIANCDQSGYYLAFLAMASMHAHLGHGDEARRWESEAEQYRQRAVELLWDGQKFLHHVHLDPIDHQDFDESAQLTMGNTWAMTRGLADAEQARRIIAEYRRRHEETGDAYPWWSLQPGYPDRLGYFGREYCKQGGYANGGLMPWVGGELCRAAFMYGEESYGFALLRQYLDHLERIDGAQVWYWPDGTPGFRTHNEVRYAGWGMAEWINALMEGLAGIVDESAQLRHVTLSPRWAATPFGQARACWRYAASDAFFAYRIEFAPDTGQVRMQYTGSGEQARVRLLEPDALAPTGVTVDGEPVSFDMENEGQSRYVCFAAPIDGVKQVVIA